MGRVAEWLAALDERVEAKDGGPAKHRRALVGIALTGAALLVAAIVVVAAGSAAVGQFIFVPAAVLLILAAINGVAYRLRRRR